MGRIRAFDIVIDNNALSHVDGVPVYSPGNQVTGVVNLHLNTSRDDVRDISISFRGRAHTQWTETLKRTRSSSLADNQRVTFTGTETYVDYKLSLWQQEHPHQKLNQGLHSFPFEFRLPLINLPPDYEGANGHVRYRLKCEIVGDSLSNAKVGRKIAVAGCPMDLNCIHNAMVSVHGESESLLSYWCCITGTVKTRASTDKRAYMPGETVYITAIVQGLSGTRYDVIIKLVQEATFRGTGSTYSSSGVTVETRTNRTCQRYCVLARKRTSGVLQRRGETTLQREPMILPDNMPDTGFEGCNIIDINYFINVAPVVSNIMYRANDTEIRLPMSIGRIPFTALPSYLATTSHIGLPAEPPPSYETATSSSLNVTSLDQSNTSFVNQAYSPEIESPRLDWLRDENVLSVPPVSSPSNNHMSNLHGHISQDPVDDRTPSRTNPPDIHGISNVSFLSDDNSVTSAVEQLSTSAKDEDDEVIGTITPPKMFASSMKDLPESQITLENDYHTEVTAQVSAMKVSRNSQSDTNSQDGEPDLYFLPAYDNQLFCKEDVFIEDTTNQESELQPILSLPSFFKPLGNSVIGQRTSSLETQPPPSPWKDEHPSDFDRKCQPVKEKSATIPFESQVTTSIVANTRTWKDYVLLSERNETHEEGALADDQHVAEEEAHSEPLNLILVNNKKSVDAHAARHRMPSLEFSLAGVSTHDSREETDNKQRIQKRQWSLSNDNTFRNIDANPRQQSRTPSPYFHPDDQREAKDDDTSVSSYGSYSASSHIPRERRHAPRLEERTRSKSHDHSRGCTLPLHKCSHKSFKHSEYYGSLERPRKSRSQQTSHDFISIREMGGGSCDRQKWSTPTSDASSVNLLRHRHDLQKFQHAVSLPKIDGRNTNSYKKLENNKPSPSRRQMAQELDIVARRTGLGLRSYSSPRLKVKSSTQKRSRSQSSERYKHKQFLNPNIEHCQTSNKERTSFLSAVEQTIQDEESSDKGEIEPPFTRHYLGEYVINNHSSQTQVQHDQDYDNRVSSPPEKQRRYETFV